MIPNKVKALNERVIKFSCYSDHSRHVGNRFLVTKTDNYSEFKPHRHPGIFRHPRISLPHQYKPRTFSRFTILHYCTMLIRFDPIVYRICDLYFSYNKLSNATTLNIKFEYKLWRNRNFEYKKRPSHLVCPCRALLWQ